MACYLFGALTTYKTKQLCSQPSHFPIFSDDFPRVRRGSLELVCMYALGERGGATISHDPKQAGIWGEGTVGSASNL